MKLVSRADFARLCGRSNATITMQCRHKIAACCVGDRIDIEHPVAVAYLKATRKTPTVATSRGPRPRLADVQTREQSKPKPTHPPPPAPKGKPGRKRVAAKTLETPGQAAPRLDDSGFAQEIAGLTAREISERWGTTRSYADWLDIIQKLERARDLWLKNETTEGRLIERDLVASHVFGMLDALFRRLLTDVPKTTAARLYALAKSGAPLEQAEREAKELIEKQIRPAKARAAKVLRDA